MREREAFARDGFVRLRGVIPADALRLARAMLAGWVERHIAEQQAKGRAVHAYRHLGFRNRLARAYAVLEGPRYNIISLSRELVGPELFRLLNHPRLIDIAERLLGTACLSAHGGFLARARLPDAVPTGVPWHRDGTYFPGSARGRAVTLWIPLHDVTERDGCLELAYGGHLGRGKIVDPGGARLRSVRLPARRGDVICFTQRTPHRSLANLSGQVRWSIDLRYEATATASPYTRRFGFEVRRSQGAAAPDYAAWARRWSNR